MHLLIKFRKMENQIQTREVSERGKSEFQFQIF